MHKIPQSEYDKSYFNGADSLYSHTAGYTNYDRMKTYCQQKAEEIINDFELSQSDRVLELGCAKGYAVEKFIELGIDITGIDFSEYAVSCVNESIKDKVIFSDALTFLKSQADNSFDLLFSMNFLECIYDEDLSSLIAEMNRVAKQQFHITNTESRKDFYNSKEISEWEQLGFINTVIRLI